MKKALGLAALPVALVGASAGLYALYVRRARAATSLVDPDTLIEPDWRPFDANLHLDGVSNARDIGGYRTMDGRRVRRGMIYRSGDLFEATDRDLERLQALDVRLILDLRHDEEVAEAPDRLPEGAAYARLPYNAPTPALVQIAQLIAYLGRMGELMHRIYDGILLESGPMRLGLLLHYLATDDRSLPALIHCTAGKDRTGLTVAILLSVLGVADDVVFADYALSNRAYPVFYAGIERNTRTLARLGLTPDDLQPLILANPAILQAAFTDLRARFGSLEGYLAETAGVDEVTLDLLRARLLEADVED
jgi:protein-tyrosine phosphatase